MRNLILILIVIFKSNFVLAQNDSILISKIDKRTWNVENSKGKLLNKKQVKLDSIDCKIFNYKSLVEVDCYLQKSRKKIHLILYRNQTEFEKITIRENSSMPEDFWRLFIFYYSNRVMIKSEERHYSSARIEGIAGRLEDEINKQYDGNLNEIFLSKLIKELNAKL